MERSNPSSRCFPWVCVCLVISEAAVGRCRMQNLEQSHSLSHSLPLPGPSMSGGEPGGPRLPRAPHGPSLVLPNSPSSVPDRAFGAIEAKDLVSFSKPRRVSFFYWCNGIIKELKKKKMRLYTTQRSQNRSITQRDDVVLLQSGSGSSLRMMLRSPQQSSNKLRLLPSHLDMETERSTPGSSK